MRWIWLICCVVNLIIASVGMFSDDEKVKTNAKISGAGGVAALAMFTKKDDDGL